MRILLDFDEVLAEFVRPCLDMFRETTGIYVPFSEVKTFKLADSFPVPNAEELLISFMRRPNFYSDVPPIPGAVDGVRSLIADGHDVVIATALPRAVPGAWVGKVEWVRKNMPFFDVDDMVAISRKEIIEAHVLFDDRKHNLERFPYVSVAMNRRWNREAKCTYRVRDWPGFIELVPRIVERIV